MATTNQKNELHMKRLVFIITAIAMMTAVQAKKVTIEGTASKSERIYLIINEDTENAQLLPIQNGKFKVTVNVDRNAFIRLQNTKDNPRRAAAVLIPDSKIITVYVDNQLILDSDKSQELNHLLMQMESNSPESLHVDVFSQDPQAWKDAREHENALRESMRNSQRNAVKELLMKDKNNIILAWIAYCYPEVMEGELQAMVDAMKPKWINHPILQKH